jgi:hypothetical protein
MPRRVRGMDQPTRVQRRLVLAPFRPGLGDVRSILLGGPERLFLSDRVSIFNVCQTSPTLHVRSSVIVTSPRSATYARIAA